MLRSRVLALPLLSAWLTACSFVVDFDRSKIDHHHGDGGMDGGGGSVENDGSVGDGDGDGDGDVQMDGGHDAAPESDARVGCENDEGCASNQLCCNNVCVDTSLAACTACGVACASSAASACEGRVCKCGAEAACLGADAFCVDGASAPTCVECRTSDDCPEAKGQCVDGVCQECVPGANNAGCGGTKPICNATSKTCEACTSSPDNCSGVLVCTGSGACGGCNNSMTDCANPDEPICSKTSTMCEACKGAGVASSVCQTEQGKPYCVDNAKCSVCLPDTEQGCAADSAKPDCRLQGDQYACQGCVDNDSCKHLGGRDTCDAVSGKCVECKGHADCTDAMKPLCGSDGLCKRCDQASGDAGCAAKSDSTCDEGTGTCVECTGNGECTDPNKSVCFNNTCVQCTTATEVTKCGNDVCVANACIDCKQDVQCNAHAGKQCVTVAAGNTECRECDPAVGENNAGCTGLNICSTSAFTCEEVECLASADCHSAAKPICNTGSHTCVACNTDQECDAKTAGSLCASSGPNSGHCGACDPSGDRGCTAPNDQCRADTLTCVACDDDTGCAADEVCDNPNYKCVDCLSQQDCSGNLACVSKACTECAPGTTPVGGDCKGTNDACVDVGGGAFECRDCDPAQAVGAQGCTNDEACQPDFTCAPVPE